MLSRCFHLRVFEIFVSSLFLLVVFAFKECWLSVIYILKADCQEKKYPFGLLCLFATLAKGILSSESLFQLMIESMEAFLLIELPQNGYHIGQGLHLHFLPNILFRIRCLDVNLWTNEIQDFYCWFHYCPRKSVNICLNTL